MTEYHRSGPLSDSTTHGPGTELFVVEGQSAARALNRLRSPERQAVLAMQGKPMNATRASEAAIRRNPHLGALVAALGTGIGPDADIDQVRYERVILLFDPDADGIHARTLLLLFFDEYLRPLLEAGRIFDARVPRWRLASAQLERPYFAGTDEQLNRLRTALGDEGVTEFDTTRYRGVGSIEDSVLRSFCLDRESRRLEVLSPADAANAREIMAQFSGPT